MRAGFLPLPAHILPIAELTSSGWVSSHFRPMELGTCRRRIPCSVRRGRIGIGNIDHVVFGGFCGCLCDGNEGLERNRVLGQGRALDVQRPRSTQHVKQATAKQSKWAEAKRARVDLPTAASRLRVLPRSSPGRVDRSLLILSAMAAQRFCAASIRRRRDRRSGLGSDSGFLFTSLFAG